MSKVKLFRNLIRDCRGGTAIEYGLILSLVVIALVVGLGNLGAQNNGIWGGFTGKAVAAMASK